jgi:hypothetical protein
VLRFHREQYFREITPFDMLRVRLTKDHSTTCYLLLTPRQVEVKVEVEVEVKKDRKTARPQDRKTMVFCKVFLQLTVYFSHKHNSLQNLCNCISCIYKFGIILEFQVCNQRAINLFPQAND